ncbi:hypothetical protein BJV78DRAFT_1249554 [Lactifluus subvellereus]|nr:hypothetical protein BJV78DRAFT_1249554 [Lactifluus subvellereus]
MRAVGLVSRRLPLPSRPPSVARNTSGTHSRQFLAAYPISSGAPFATLLFLFRALLSLFSLLTPSFASNARRRDHLSSLGRNVSGRARSLPPTPFLASNALSLRQHHHHGRASAVTVAQGGKCVKCRAYFSPLTPSLTSNVRWREVSWSVHPPLLETPAGNWAGPCKPLC